MLIRWRLARILMCLTAFACSEDRTSGRTLQERPTVKLDHYPIVRGTVGVLKDVSEFWMARAPGRPAGGRYHYHAAIFSSSDFTSQAQDYAFAHDVYLLPLARSSYFSPVIAAMNAAATALPTNGGQVPGVVLSELRRRLRKLMQPDIGLADETRSQYQRLAPFVDATRAVGRSLIATLGPTHFSFFSHLAMI